VAGPVRPLTSRVELRLDLVADGVELHVVGSGVHELGVVSEQTEPVVASLTEQTADCAALVIVIEMLRRLVTTYRAAIALCFAQS
jgi:hypothetical protein